MCRNIIVIFSLFLALPCAAATTEWESFDLNNCRHWSMTPDDYQGDGDGFEEATKLSEEMNSKDESKKWIVVAGNILYELGGEFYGVCRFPSIDLIACSKGLNFPLSGATYKKIGDKFSLETYQCINGCDNTDVQMIHDMGYETDELNSEYQSLYNKFELKCNEKQKIKTFYEEYRKRSQEQK